MAEGARVPRKYWWVVAVAVPVVLAVVAIVPNLLKSTGGGPSGGTGNPINITGDNNTVTFDYSTNKTFVTNVNVIAREYELQTGQPLSSDLRAQVEAAVKAAMDSNHAESVRLLEKVAQAVPVPAIYNNLGVEYAKTQNGAASDRAFELSKAKIAEATAATNRPPATDTPKAAPASGPGVRTEPSAIPAMIIEPLGPPYTSPGEIHVVTAGTATGGSYQVKYKPQPGATVAMDPGAYDVLFKDGSYGAGFVFASNVTVREGTLTRVNPNAFVGGLAIDAVSKRGFPVLKSVEFVDRGSGTQRLLAQRTDTLGVTLPLAPGNYEAVGTTEDGQTAVLAGDVTVRAGQIAKFNPFGQVAVILVHAPAIKGLDMKAVYALKAGGNQIAAKVAAWDTPMIVAASSAYDVALEQPAGLTRLKSGVTLAPGELLEIR